MTPTQFAWSCIGRATGQYPPPEPKRGAQFGTSDQCWLCGGPTEGVGWPRDTAIPTTFASHNTARAQSSDAVCQACAYFAVGETWHQHISSQPDLGVKLWGTASWRNYGHFFAPGFHECPKPSRWREILLSPPATPFLACISLTGQKNIIFRGRVALDADAFPVQAEEESIWVEREQFEACLAAFEGVMALGIARDQALEGRYNHAAMMAAGISRWREAEAALAPWRRGAPHLMTLAHYCARRPDPGIRDSTDSGAPSPVETEEPPVTRPPPAQSTGQLSLF